MGAGDASACFLFSAESRPRVPWVGLLACGDSRVGCRVASPSPASRRVVIEASALTYSGGTAPDLHRTSLLCPSWAPKARPL